MQNHSSYQEHELLERFRRGDSKAFAHVYQRYSFDLYQYAKRWLPDKEDAEDIVADTFVKLWSRKDSFSNLDNINAFLKITARHACLDFLKHLQVKHDKYGDLLRILSKSDEPDFTWQEVRREFMKLVYDEVEKMPKKMKEVFLLSYKEGLKPQEIAFRLGLSVQTVSNQKTNAIKFLKSSLGNEPLLFALLMLLETEQLWLC